MNIDPRELERAAGLQSLLVLGKDILGYDRFCDTQASWDAWAMEHITPGSWNLIEQPRETFKTTFFCICFTIQYLLKNPNGSVYILHEKYKTAKKILSEIKDQFETCKKLIDYYGPQKSDKRWSDESITIRSRIRPRKEPSVFIGGKESVETGIHPDVILCTDIAGKDDIYYPVSRESTLTLFQAVWDLLAKKIGIFILEGTRKHVNDINWHILENVNKDLIKEGLQTFNYLHTPVREGSRIDGKIMFPSILPEKVLRQLRIVKRGSDGIDEATFWAEYMLKPLDPKTQVFKTFHYYNHASSKYKMFIQITDPAATQGKKACFAPVIVLGLIDGGPNNNRWGVVYASMVQRKPSQTIRDHNRIYRMLFGLYPNVDYDTYMEENGFQAFVMDAGVQKSLDDEEGVPVPTIGIQSNTNKDAKIRNMEPAITQGLLLFRDDWKTAPEAYRLLLDQLQQYPQGFVDGPDDLAMGYRKSREMWLGMDDDEPDKDSPEPLEKPQEPKGEEDEVPEIAKNRDREKELEQWKDAY